MSDNVTMLPAGKIAEQASSENGKSRERSVAAGGVMGAILASSCCILPLALTLAGVSGAWMAHLRALAPYQPVFIALTLAALGYGFYLVYWKPRACAGEACAAPMVPGVLVRSALWLASVIVLLATTFAYWFPLIVPYLP